MVLYKCSNCGDKIYKNYLCKNCFSLLTFINEEVEEENYKIYIILKYQGLLKNLLINFKFKDSTFLSKVFGDIMTEKILSMNLISKYDFFCPIPMYEKNRLKRGYNQVELIGDYISSNTLMPYKKALKKIKATKDQVGLNKIQREKNLKGAFFAENVENKKILLIDDIFTTGSTIKEARKELIKKGALKVDALVLCS